MTTWYTHAYEDDNDEWVVQLKLLHPPFEEDENGDLDYSESIVLVAIGATKEMALLQIRAALNSAIGGVELDILRNRGQTPTIRTGQDEEPDSPYDGYDGMIVYEEGDDEDS